jgi:uncharacterized protein
MKFQPDTFVGTNAISRHEQGVVWVNNQRFEGALLVPWRGEVRAWSATDHATLVAEHFSEVLTLKPELVIFGSGARLRFISAALYQGLIEARIGLETMDSAAACRTYNVLAAEGRSVVAALLPGSAG